MEIIDAVAPVVLVVPAEGAETHAHIHPGHLGKKARIFTKRLNFILTNLLVIRLDQKLWQAEKVRPNKQMSHKRIKILIGNTTSK